MNTDLSDVMEQRSVRQRAKLASIKARNFSKLDRHISHPCRVPIEITILAFQGDQQGFHRLPHPFHLMDSERTSLGSFHRGQKVIDVVWFWNEVSGTLLDQVHCIPHRPVTCCHDNAEIWIFFERLHDQFVTAHAWHVEICHQDVPVFSPYMPESLLAILYGGRCWPPFGIQDG